MPSGRAPAQAATAETLAASAQASDEVHIDNFAYSPAVLTIPAGTKVTWINRDDVPHTVTAADRQFNSGALDTDGQYSRVFSQAGTYSYFCALHPHMKGKIIVR
jgi:plastocyanin